MISRCERTREPTIGNYIARYRQAKEFLIKHLEQKELLERKMKEAGQEIVEYFTSDSFVERIKYINI
jgi:hypothetical protein